MAARRALVEAVMRTENYFSLFLSQQKFQAPSRCVNRIVTNVREFSSGRRNCSDNGSLSSLRTKVNCKDREDSPQKVDMTISDASKTERKVGQTRNIAYGSTVIDGSTGEWLTLDQKVNTYPSVRRFTAIGLGGDDFVKSMVVAVESVIQHSIPWDHVRQRVSSGRKYVSVNIGPVRVVSSEQVTDADELAINYLDKVKKRPSLNILSESTNIRRIDPGILRNQQVRAVYTAMRSDDRMKFFL